MVSIIENKAKIKGIVNAVHENADPQGHWQLEVKLENSADVEGYPNLAKADEGSVIRINIKPEQLDKKNITTNSPLSATVRKVFGQQYFMDSSEQESD